MLAYMSRFDCGTQSKKLVTAQESNQLWTCESEDESYDVCAETNGPRISILVRIQPLGH